MQIKRQCGKIAKTFLAFSALFASAFVGADQYPYANHPAHMPQDPCCNWGCPPCCNEAPACGWGYNPPGYFTCGECCGNNGFFDTLRVRADFLWWRACEEGLALGTEEFVSDFPEGELIQRSKVKHPDFKFDPGFRIGIATICPCDCWDAALNWTHFHTKATAKGATQFPFSEGGFSQVQTVFVNCWERVPYVTPDFSKGKWTLDLDLLDLEFGRKYYVSDCFILRPNLGLRGARIDQGFRVRSEANRLEPYEFGGDQFFTSDVKAKNNFLGLGPRVGLDLELKFGCGFKLFGQAAGSLVFGRFDRHSKERFEDFGTFSDFNELHYEADSTKDRCSRGMTDLAIGLKWEHCFCWCNQQHPFSLAFSWEHHAFYDFNNFVFERDFGFEACESERCGDLFTQGLTMSVEFGF